MASKDFLPGDRVRLISHDSTYNRMDVEAAPLGSIGTVEEVIEDAIQVKFHWGVEGIETKCLEKIEEDKAGVCRFKRGDRVRLISQDSKYNRRNVEATPLGAIGMVEEASINGDLIQVKFPTGIGSVEAKCLQKDGPVPDDVSKAKIFYPGDRVKCLEKVGEPGPAEHKTIVMAEGKITSSVIPHFHLIPTEALARLAKRFQLGIERKGDKCWNAISPNQDALADKELVLHRIGHVIDHAMKLRDKIVAGEDLLAEDDAAAIMWAGAFLCCATKAIDANSNVSPENAK